MALFLDPDERVLMEGFNAEMYGLFFHDVEVYKPTTTDASTYDDFYHEDINRVMPGTPTYIVPGYINVSDNGMANLYKGGKQVDRQLILYFSRKVIEDKLRFEGLDIYKAVPFDGDNVKVQGIMFKIITVDPEGYHVGNSYHPFDYAALIKPEAVTPLTTSPRLRKE